MNVIGIDVGTTTLSFVVVESETGRVLKAKNCSNDSNLTGSHPWEKIQDANRTYELVKKQLKELLKEHGEIGAIGITGQMHGIVYLDGNGRAVSPLYTWQDERAANLCKDEKSYAKHLSEASGYHVAVGYGSATHYYHVVNGQVEPNAKTFCTIADYIALRLANVKTPVLHVSNGASLGLYSFETGDFDREAIGALGLKENLFPKVTREYRVMGHTDSNIPVCVAIGDNQASFLGSVKERDSILVNVGTGSQLSYYHREGQSPEGMELRPLVENADIAVGSCLCGGRAYAVLKNFYEKILDACGLTCPDLYEAMNRMAAGYESLKEPLTVATQFSGTRENPALRGSITNLGVANFTPEHVTTGVLWGMVNELYEMYESSTKGKGGFRCLVGSGNGIRRNQVLKELFQEKFQMDLKIPLYEEEAAYGACLFALVAVGACETIEEAQKKIPYIGE